MHIYINIIDKSFLKSSQWNDINRIFKQQSPEWRPGKKILGVNKSGSNTYFLFILYITLIYRNYIILVVKSRRWEKFWIPLSPKYLEQKKKKGRYENIWMNTGTLINAIEISYDKNMNKVKVGINEHLQYKLAKGKSISILQIAKWMEYGTVKMPARPLFRMARSYISKHIKRFNKDFEGFLKAMNH